MSASLATILQPPLVAGFSRPMRPQLLVTSMADVDALIQQLQEIKSQLSLHAEAVITILVGETKA